MSDKSLTLALPEELIERAKAARIDLRQVLIEALEAQLPQSSDDIVPSLDEVEAAIQDSMRRLSSNESERRVLGLHRGTVIVSDDFDKPLSDDFWFNENK